MGKFIYIKTKLENCKLFSKTNLIKFDITFSKND